MNQFLASLDNMPAAPVNPSSVTGDVVWPSPFYTHTFTTAETTARTYLFQSPGTRLLNFTAAIQLMWVVQGSVLGELISATDPIITYNDEQLAGQFIGVDASNRQIVSTALSTFSNIPASFLTGNLAYVYNNAFSRYDRLAAIIAHFGTKTAPT